MDLTHFLKKFDNFLKNKKNFNLLNKILSKILAFNKIYSNYFLNIYELVKKRDYLNSYPTLVGLNTTNICNYKCKFCEIHFFHKFAKEKCGKIFPNHISLDFINKFKNLFERTASIELSGASGEPLVNPHFVEVCKKLKKNRVSLSVTTNGSLLDKNMAKELVNMKFNHVMFSLHSGKEEIYSKLQGGNFHKVLDNLENLVKTRNKAGNHLPKVSVNCLVFKLNMHTIKDLIKKLKEIKVDEMNINHYYASRNKINGKTSFYFYPVEGNQFLRDIYQYAKSINFNLTPKNPSFISNTDKEYKSQGNSICESPWQELKLIGCVEFKDSHYVGICNRILLLRLDYEEFEGDLIEDIWNHEIMRYFRKTVMKNPMCQFCRNPNTPKLRCLNNKLYQQTRDEAIRNFFNEAFNNVKIKSRMGIFLLKEHPYEYIDYYETN